MRPHKPRASCETRPPDFAPAKPLAQGSLRRRPLNISAALAIAIDRQVEDIIANAKAQCALHYGAAPQAPPAAPAAFAPRADVGGWEVDALRPGLDFSAPGPAFGEPAPETLLDFWKRLRSLLTPRAFRA